MDNNEEFYDTFETYEQLNLSIIMDDPDIIRNFHSEQSHTQEDNEKIEEISKYKTDCYLPINKTTLFSWTTKNLTKKTNKDIKEFSGLEVIQEIILEKEHNRNWVLKFSPDCNYLALAGESPIILMFHIYKKCSERNPDILEMPIQYSGHNQSIINIVWEFDSQSFLSCSADCLVLLWRTGHTIPIKQFIHCNIVTCIGFYPIDSNIFFTGCLDKKVCLWSINEEKIDNTYQVQGLITAGSYSPNGLLLALGMSNGGCIFYEVHHNVLTYLTQIHCKNRTGFKSSGKKVTGIEYQDDQYVLISTNDSRIRLYNLTDFRIIQKYKGGISEQYPIRCTFSHNFIHIIRGSEDGKVFVWNTFKAETKKKWIRRPDEKNNSCEYFKLNKSKGNSDAVFAPSNIIARVQRDYIDGGSEVIISHIIISSVAGRLYVLYNQFKNVPW